MKKILLTVAIALGGFAMMNAQEISKNAIGLRLGDGDGFGAEVSYQRAVGDDNRLEFVLGIRDGKNFDGFSGADCFQIIFFPG